jgi:hypothetical protein
MLKAVDRKAFAVHLDPCNLVNSPERYYRASELIRECYAKLGPLVASVHAKDLTWDVEMAVHFREVRIGLGSIDYAVFLAEHARHATAAHAEPAGRGRVRAARVADAGRKARSPSSEAGRPTRSPRRPPSEAPGRAPAPARHAQAHPHAQHVMELRAEVVRPGQCEQ